MIEPPSTEPPSSDARLVSALAGVAATALDADCVVVVAEGRQPPLILALEPSNGLDVAEVSELVGDLGAGVGDAATVQVSTLEQGRTRAVSARLEDDGGRRVGAVHALYRSRNLTLHPDRVSSLLRAFARHISLTLAHGAFGRPTEQMALALEALSGLDDLADTAITTEDITAKVKDALSPLLGASKVGITIWDQDLDILRALPGAFDAAERDLASIAGPMTDLRSLSARVLRTGRPYLSNCASADPGILQAYVDIFGLERVISVPLVSRNQRIGVLHLANKATDFTVGDLALAVRLAPRIAMAIELAEVVRRITLREQLGAILATTAIAVASGSAARECLLPAFERFGEVTDASMVTLVPESGAALVWHRDGQSSGLTERFLADARGSVSGSVGAYPHHAGDPGWAAVHAPVELEGETTGRLSALRPRGQPFAREESDALGRLASLAALALAGERYQQQRAQLARLQERQRIADELHDRVSQIFFAAQLGLDSVLDGEGGGTDRERLVEVRGLLTKGEVCIRDVIHQLSPPRLGLAEPLRRMISEVEDDFGVTASVDLSTADAAALATVSDAVAETALRVAREAVVNAAKHAGPCRIDVQIHIRSGTTLVVAVTDDGCGMDPAVDLTASHGVRSMRRAVEEVGGVISIAPAPSGTGTCVTAQLPL